MRTNITLHQDDICKVCNEKCPNDIYECELLKNLINQKKALYKWCWILKDSIDNTDEKVTKEFEEEFKRDNEKYNKK